MNEHQEFITGKDYVGGKGDATKPGEWFSFKPTITTAGSGYVVGERITLNTSRANCPKGMILEVTSVNGSGGVTGIKPIQWSDGTQASFETEPLAWLRGITLTTNVIFTSDKLLVFVHYFYCSRSCIK